MGRLVRYPPYWDKDLERVEDFIDNLWKYQPSNSKGSSGRPQRGKGREKEEKGARSGLCPPPKAMQQAGVLPSRRRAASVLGWRSAVSE